MSGVCENVIDLATCPRGPGTGTPNGCTSDGQCSYLALNRPCVEGFCSAGTCATRPAARGTVCRDAPDVCALPAVCTGDSLECPANPFADATTICRPAAGACDSAEFCSGEGPACPSDTFLPEGTLCRAASGDCDLPELCRGEAQCPEDAVANSSVVCRAQAGLCDIEETCDGIGKACPEDIVLPKDTVCREAAGVCDQEEVCDGVAATCGPDAFKPSTHVCRAAADKCDKPELCTGASVSCPGDQVLRNFTKAFKCGKACYVCGVPDELTYEQKLGDLTQLRNTWALGGCNMGSCEVISYFLKDTPAYATYCTSAPVPLICPNNKALSNIEHAVCDGSTGTWTCVAKQEALFSGPVSPPW